MTISPAEAAPVFAALGDPTRLALVIRLSDGRSLSIATLAAGTGLSRQGVTKHLRVLEGCGLVTPERAGRETRYAMRPAALGEARDLLDRVGRQWEAALGRLKSLVER